MDLLELSQAKQEITKVGLVNNISSRYLYVVLFVGEQKFAHDFNHLIGKNDATALIISCQNIG